MVDLPSLSSVFTIISLAIASAAVGVSFYGARNAARASKQSAANGAVAAEINAKLDGRLTALINSIHARAESEAAAARSDAWLRESRAFSAGQENVRAVEPPATAAQVAELRVVTLSATEAILGAKTALGQTEGKPVHVHVVTDDSPVAVHVVPPAQ